MLFSLRKLRELAGLSSALSDEQIYNAINSIGFEVESTAPFTDVDGVKFGKVLKTSINPHGEKLTVCEIQFSDRIRIIQTTATNVVPGAYVIAFIPGARKGNTVFAAKELRQIVSEGMLSSLSELMINPHLTRPGLSEGITLYENVSLTTDPLEYLGLRDTIIEVKVLSNRADANSYFAMALELAAFFKTSVALPKRRAGSLKSSFKAVTGEALSLVAIEAERDFTISYDEQILLAKSGIRAISDIVDLTNLALLMTGQPVHAYDKASLGPSIRAEHRSGEVAIFGSKLVALEKNLVITSQGTIVAVAGVIGIENYGVTTETKRFILELGRFKAQDVRTSLRAIKINTMAGKQSGKELSPGLTSWAIDFMSQYLNNFSDPINYVESAPKVLSFSKAKFAVVAGVKNVKNDPHFERARKALLTLGYQFKGTKIIPPLHISGIESQQDLNEEFLRFYGLNNLVSKAPIITPTTVRLTDKLKHEVAALGYQEVISYTLVARQNNQFNPLHFPNELVLQTYFSRDHEVIRNSVIPALLDNVNYHARRRIDHVNLFEIANVHDGSKVLALVTTTKTFNELKQDVVNLLGANLQFKASTANELHPHAAADIFWMNHHIGYIGRVNPALRSEAAVVAEVKIMHHHHKVKFRPYAADPLKSRDITFTLQPGDEIGKVFTEIRQLGHFYEIRQIDSFVKNDLRNVTLRIIGTDAVIAKLDTHYNK